MKQRIIILFISLFILTACISSEQATNDGEKKAEEVYVFDDVKKVEETKTDTVKVEIPKVEVKQEPVKVEAISVVTKKYTIQLGAFTSKERADIFVKENQSKTSLPMNISFNAKTNLFTVQVPPYGSKEEADMIRDNLRKFPAFKDSFTVVTEN